MGEIEQKLIGREIDINIAEALGRDVRWVLHNGIRELVDFTGVNATVVPFYHADANVILALCAERHWKISYEVDDYEDGVADYVVWIETNKVTINEYGLPTSHYYGGANSWQEAASRAFLSAIRAESSQKPAKITEKRAK